MNASIAPSTPVASRVLVRELRESDRGALLNHFLALPDHDRALRFGQSVQDEVLRRYVERLNFKRDTLLGVNDEHLQLVGVAHLAYLDETKDGMLAEFGVSTLPEWRGRGVGTALFERAAMHCRNTRVTTLFVHCLARNNAMMHIARKAGMQVHYEGGEADAYLKLPPADAVSFLDEAAQEQVARLDYQLKQHNEKLRVSTQSWWQVISKANTAHTASSAPPAAPVAAPALATA